MKEFEDILEEISHNLEWCDDAYQSRCYRRSHDEITRLRAENEKLREQLRGEIESHQAMTKAYENEIKMLKESRPHIEAAEREKLQKMLARMGAGTTKTGAGNE